MELESTRDDLLYEVFKISEEEGNKEPIEQSVCCLFIYLFLTMSLFIILSQRT